MSDAEQLPYHAARHRTGGDAIGTPIHAEPGGRWSRRHTLQQEWRARNVVQEAAG